MLFALALDTMRSVARGATYSGFSPALLTVGGAPDTWLELPGLPPLAAEIDADATATTIRWAGVEPVTIVDGSPIQLGVWTLYLFRVRAPADKQAEVRRLESFLDDPADAPALTTHYGRELRIGSLVPVVLGSAGCCALRAESDWPPLAAVLFRDEEGRVWLHPIPGVQVQRNDALVRGRARLVSGDSISVLARGARRAMRFEDPHEEVDRLLGVAAVSPDEEAAPPVSASLRDRVGRVLGAHAHVSYEEAALLAGALGALAAYVAAFAARF